MISFLPALLVFLALFLIEVFYFKIADRFNIIDKPNARSSHQTVTLRGGGIIFCLAGLIFFFFYGLQYFFFVLGLLAIATISFLDDIFTLDNRIRLIVQLIAVSLLLYQWDLFRLSWYWILIAVVFVIGTINAYNFMDGINGITGSYSLLAVSTLFYVNEYIVSFTAPNFLIIVGLSLLVFNFFNFRKQAKCFAGDVGSVSIAFIIVFLIGQLILKTNNLTYILLLLVYGFDTAFTVIFRKIRKENIFEAHRHHFYQYLVNEKKMSHLAVAAMYFMAQLVINLCILFWITQSALLSLIFVFILGIGFLLLRFFFEGWANLLRQKE